MVGITSPPPVTFPGEQTSPGPGWQLPFRHASPTVQTTTFSGSLNPGNPTRSFSVVVGAGVANARLSFVKCSSLSVGLSNGASANGPSVVALDATVAAGTYMYTVSGGRCSFTLTVTAPTP